MIIFQCSEVFQTGIDSRTDILQDLKAALDDGKEKDLLEERILKKEMVLNATVNKNRGNKFGSITIHVFGSTGVPVTQEQMERSGLATLSLKMKLVRLILKLQNHTRIVFSVQCRWHHEQGNKTSTFWVYQAGYTR